MITILPSSNGSVFVLSDKDNWTDKDWVARSLQRWCNNCQWFAPVVRDFASVPLQLRLTYVIDCKELIIIWSSKKELKGFTWKKERIRPIGNDSAHVGKFGSRVYTVCRCRFSPNTIEKHLLHSSPVKDYAHEHLPLNFSAEVVLPQRRWPKDVVLAQHAVDVEDGPSPIDLTATACGRKGKQSTMDHWSIETDLMSIGSLGFSVHRQQCHLKVVRPVLMKSHLMKRSSSKDCCWDYCCCCLSSRCLQ